MRRNGYFHGRRGHAIVETALLAPWIFLLFLGLFDFGFYAYSLIATANAARVAALATSSSDGTAADLDMACRYALDELRYLPNVGSTVDSCLALPVKVNAQSLPKESCPGGEAPCSKVSVTYQTIQLFPIPGLAGRLTVNRAAVMRVKS